MTVPHDTLNAAKVRNINHDPRVRKRRKTWDEVACEREVFARVRYKVQQQWRIMWMNYLTATRVAARSTRVSFCHAIWLANEKTKVFTSQKSFSGSGSQTLFSAEPVTEKLCLRLQARDEVTVQWNWMGRIPLFPLLFQNGCSQSLLISDSWSRGTKTLGMRLVVY